MRDKNKYIYDEEVAQLITNLPEKHKRLEETILLIYNEGYTLFKALDGIPRRTAQRVIKKSSNGKISFRDLKNAYIYNNVPKNLLNILRRNGSIKPGIRWDILNRDHFKCVKCGRSSKEVILHIDHILPLARGGKTEEQNLQCLCSECNWGKQDKIE